MSSETFVQFLRLCLTGSRDDALALWNEHVVPHLTEASLCVGSPTYHLTADQRWWLWCRQFNEPERGLHALQRLLLTERLPWDASQALQKEALPLVMQLPTQRTVQFAPVIPSGYAASSPSIVSDPDDPDGFLVSVRHVNYRFTPDNQYPLLPDYVRDAPSEFKDCVRTTTVLLTCRRDLSIKSSSIMADRTTFFKWPSRVMDLEDLRLVALPSGLVLGTATSLQTRVDRMPVQVLVTVNRATRELTHGLPLKPHDPEHERVAQKNWLPFWCSRTHKLLAFYMFGPEAILYALDPVTGTATVERTWPTRVAMHAVRGGAPPIPWENGMYLSVVHTALQLAGIRRKYFHRFVLHAPDYRPVAVSQQWNFSGTAYDAEFVISCAHASPASVYVGYGQNDGVSNVAEVTIDTIRALAWYKLTTEE